MFQFIYIDHLPHENDPKLLHTWMVCDIQYVTYTSIPVWIGGQAHAEHFIAYKPRWGGEWHPIESKCIEARSTGTTIEYNPSSRQWTWLNSQVCQERPLYKITSAEITIDGRVRKKEEREHSGTTSHFIGTSCEQTSTEIEEKKELHS